MRVYFSSTETCSTREALAALLAEVRPAGAPSRDDATAWLVELGRLEAALSDAGPETHGAGPLKGAMLAAGLVFVHTASRSHEAAALARVSLAGHLARALAARLPHTLALARPEGFTQYAVYPDAYLSAAEAFLRARRPSRLVVVGLRGIGTALSAVVTAAAAHRGVRTLRLTARPEGPAFARRLAFTPHAARRLAAWNRADALVVDEGPGLSGSSFAGAAAALSSAGFPDERVALLPSWEADAAAFLSADARDRWRRHATWVGRYVPERIAGTRDLSRGAWRALVYAHPDEWPAVHPVHERAKYLAGDPGRPGGARLIKFAGLGSAGRRAEELARALAAAGWSPPVEEFGDGLLVTTWLPGRPLRARDASRAIVDHLARYAAARARSFPAREPGASLADLREMVLANARLALGLGRDAAGLEPWLARLEAAAANRPATVLDGRMDPHEWILGPGGLAKTDAVDHHHEHFYPGCQDVAWDLAGAAVTFGLDRAGTAALLDNYVRRSGDHGVRAAFPFHRVAFLAFRCGAARMAADALRGSAEAARHEAVYARLRDALQAETNLPAAHAARTGYA